MWFFCVLTMIWICAPQFIQAVPSFWCSFLPPARIFGPVINIANSNWQDFQADFSGNTTAFVILQSTREDCRVEAKFEQLFLSGSKAAFFPLGRNDILDYTLQPPLANSFEDACDQGPLFFFRITLGQSFFSDLSEIAVGFIVPPQESIEYEYADSPPIIRFHLVYRRVCPEDQDKLPRSEYLPLRPPPQNGTHQRFLYEPNPNFPRFQNGFVPYKQSYIRWTLLPPTSSCGLSIRTIRNEATPVEQITVFDFDEYEGDYEYSDGYPEEAIVGPTLSSNPRFTRVHVTVPYDARAEFEYWAVCKPQPHDFPSFVAITDLDFIPTPPVTKDWQYVNLTRDSIPSMQVFVWSFSGIEHPRDVQIETVPQNEYEYEHYTPADAFSFFESDISDSLRARYPQQPFFGIQAPKRDSRNVRFVFRYRRAQPFRPAPQVLLVPPDGLQYTWNFTSDDPVPNRILLRVQQSGCFVTAQVFHHEQELFASNAVEAILFPKGFYSDIADRPEEDDYLGPDSIEVFADARRWANSIGPEMGIAIRLPIYRRGPIDIQLAYYSSCPSIVLPLKGFNADWKKAIVPFQVVASIPVPLQHPTCWTDLVLLTASNLFGLNDFESSSASEVRVVCPAGPRESDVQNATLLKEYSFATFQCDSGAAIFIQALKTTAELAYRVRCVNDSATHASSSSSSLVFGFEDLPLPGQQIRATSRPKKINEGTVVDTMLAQTKYLTRSWSIRTPKTDCRIKLKFQRIDLAMILVYEDAASRRLPLHPKPARPAASVSDMEYVSCSNHVILESPGSVWGVATNQRFKATYQTLCPRSSRGNRRRPRTTKQRQHRNANKGVRAGDQHIPTLGPDRNDTVGQCGDLQINLKAEWQTWRTFDFDAWNFNQVRLTTFLVRPTNFSNSLKNVSIEIKFLSLVEQAWFDHSDLAEDGRGVYIQGGNSSIWHRATTGSPWFFPARFDVKIRSNLILQSGFHVFSIQYRLVPSSINGTSLAREADRTLVAKSKPQRLDFKVPLQFSQSAKAKALKRVVKVKDDDSNAEGFFSVWVFNYGWKIQAENASCRPVIVFQTLDIGGGYVDSGFEQTHNRLSVISNVSEGFNINADRRCAGGLPQAWLDKGISTSSPPICARTNAAFVSSDSDSLGLLFRSSDHMTEYEYENGYGGPKDIALTFGRETTWGAGWSAMYYQVCSEVALSKELQKNAPIQLRAGKRWKTLPGLKGKPSLFVSKQYSILPPHAGCLVQIKATSDDSGFEGPIEVYGDGQQLEFFFDPSINKDFSLAGRFADVLVVLFGRARSSPVTFSFRESCTSTSTSSPSLSPTKHMPTFPPRSVENGWSCLDSEECMSEICSSSLGMCLSKTCTVLCNEREGGTRAVCESFTSLGCACTWVSNHCQAST